MCFSQTYEITLSSGFSSHKLRKGFNITLVESISNHIESARVKRLLYNVKAVNLTTKENGALVIQEISLFCIFIKARIPSRKTDHCINYVLNP